MSAAKTDSGITFLGDLPWGSHFCQFYQTKKDMLDILIPYFKAGLQNNEFCVWVTSEFLTTEHALKAMKKGVPGFPEYLQKGQVEIFPYTDWYLKGGKFDLQRTLDMWMEKHNQALAKGFAGMRVTGNPYWLSNRRDWDDFACYEAEINKVIGGTNLLVLCTYSLQRCGVVEILDVIKNHEFALAMNQGHWRVVTTPGLNSMPVQQPS
jgi:MEDS: MEthanogen/methylotroph, DcmR Sensory domain